MAEAPIRRSFGIIVPSMSGSQKSGKSLPKGKICEYLINSDSFSDFYEWLLFSNFCKNHAPVEKIKREENSKGWKIQNKKRSVKFKIKKVRKFKIQRVEKNKKTGRNKIGN